MRLFVSLRVTLRPFRPIRQAQGRQAQGRLRGLDVLAAVAAREQIEASDADSQGVAIVVGESVEADRAHRSVGDDPQTRGDVCEHGIHWYYLCAKYGVRQRIAVSRPIATTFFTYERKRTLRHTPHGSAGKRLFGLLALGVERECAFEAEASFGRIGQDGGIQEPVYFIG
jgi:hypothetical protein